MQLYVLYIEITFTLYKLIKIRQHHNCKHLRS